MTDIIQASAHRTEAPVFSPAFPRLLPSIGWILLYFALQGICINIAASIMPGAAKLDDVSALRDNPEIVVWGTIASALVQLVLMAIYLRKDDRMKQIGLTNFGHMNFVRVIGLAFIVVLSAMLFNALYANFVIPGVKMQGEYAEMRANLPMTPANIAAGILVVVVAAPLVEELLFRGFLQSALTRYLPVWAAILISSLPFALVHGQPYAIPGLMSLSIAFGYMYYRTGSLRTNIMLHMANNAFSLIIMEIS
jgi:uncharacterized protein